MRSQILLPIAAALALAACAATETGPSLEEGWTIVRETPHPALRDDARLRHWTRGRGPERERRATVFVGSADKVIDSLGELLPHCRPIDSGAAATAYAELAQLLAAEDVPVFGEALEPDPTLDRPGVGGRYGLFDANAWRLPFPPEARPYGGGWEVGLVILAPPVRNETLGYWSPWRLLHVREAVYPDGSLQFLGDRTLTNGDDAARYGSF